MFQKILFYSLTILGLILFSACQKNECEGVVCQNFSYCQDGTCICLDGYTGTFCQLEIPPKSITIHSITLFSWPDYDSSFQPWDQDGTGPDIYLAKGDGQGGITKIGKTYTNAPLGQLIFVLDPPYTYSYSSPDGPSFLIMDEDPEAAYDDVMEAIITIPWKEGNHHDTKGYFQSVFTNWFSGYTESTFKW